MALKIKEVVVNQEEVALTLAWRMGRCGEGYDAATVRQHLVDLDLPNVAKAIQDRTAVDRAMREAAKGGNKDLIVLSREGGSIEFQLTQFSIEDDARLGRIAKYLPGTKVIFDKGVCDIRVENPENSVKDNKAIADYVYEKFLAYKGLYTTAQITEMVQKLFDNHGDGIINLLGSGGRFYAVLGRNKMFVEKVGEFLNRVNPKNILFVNKVSAEAAKQGVAKVVQETEEDIFKRLELEIEAAYEHQQQQAAARKDGKALPTKVINVYEAVEDASVRVRRWYRDLGLDMAKADALVKKADRLLESRFGGKPEKPKR